MNNLIKTNQKLDLIMWITLVAGLPIYPLLFSHASGMEVFFTAIFAWSIIYFFISLLLNKEVVRGNKTVWLINNTIFNVIHAFLLLMSTILYFLILVYYRAPFSPILLVSLIFINLLLTRSGATRRYSVNEEVDLKTMISVAAYVLISSSLISLVYNKEILIAQMIVSFAMFIIQLIVIKEPIVGVFNYKLRDYSKSNHLDKKKMDNYLKLSFIKTTFALYAGTYALAKVFFRNTEFGVQMSLVVLVTMSLYYVITKFKTEKRNLLITMMFGPLILIISELWLHLSKSTLSIIEMISVVLLFMAYGFLYKGDSNYAQQENTMLTDVFIYKLNSFPLELMISSVLLLIITFAFPSLSYLAFGTVPFIYIVLDILTRKSLEEES